MILDPTGEFIRNITRHCDLAGKRVLEIGCGKGRITRDLAQHAARLLAIDPDLAAIEIARTEIAGENIEFAACTIEELSPPQYPFEIAIFSLSLHHIPVEKMGLSLERVAALLDRNGIMIIIEPGEKGTLIQAEEMFGVGDGDERLPKQAACEAVNRLKGWRVVKQVTFATLFHFDDADDFLASLAPGGMSSSQKEEICHFLFPFFHKDKIVLNADRRMDILLRIVANP